MPSDQPEGMADYMVGYVWPDVKTVFPDFLKPETTDWWVDEMTRFHEVSIYRMLKQSSNCFICKFIKLLLDMQVYPSRRRTSTELKIIFVLR